MAIEAISLKRLVRALITRVGKVRGKPFDFQNFDDRLIVQKIAYLLVKAGIIKGLPFNYYLRGPYSPDLLRSLEDTAEYSALDEKVVSEMRGAEVSLSGEDEERFQRVMALLKKHDWNSEWLELFTSALFFAELEPDPRNPNWRRVEHVLAFKKNVKKDLAQEIVREVQDCIKKSLFAL